MSISQKQLDQMLKGSHAKIRNCSPGKTPNLESNPGHETKRPYEDQAFTSPVIITIHSHRYRLADPDGISAKWAIDAIVKSGILRDDSEKYVKEVRFKQTKIKKPTEESTIITIEEVE